MIEWTSNDFATISEWSLDCVRMLCLESEITCSSYERFTKKLLDSLARGPRWVEEANKKFAEITFRRQVEEKSKEDTAIAYETAIKFVEDSISEITRLPDENKSLVRIDAIQNSAREYETKARNLENNISNWTYWYNNNGAAFYSKLHELAGELDASASQKRNSIQQSIALKNHRSWLAKCEPQLSKTGVLEEMRNAQIWGLYAGFDFQTVLCKLLATHTKSVKFQMVETGYIEIEITKRYEGIITLVFTQIVGIDAWSLTHLFQNGVGHRLTERESMQILYSLAN